jgi:two-component system sensor histidine kinase KdpD
MRRHDRRGFVLYPPSDLANIVMLFLLTVVLVGVQSGARPRDARLGRQRRGVRLLFVPPRFTFAVTDIQYLLTFADARRGDDHRPAHRGRPLYQARVASYREERTRTLYEFARDLPGCSPRRR